MKNSWLDKTEYEGIGTKSKCSYLTYIDFKIKSVTFLIYTKILFTPSNWEVLPNNWEFIISSLLIIYYWLPFHFINQPWAKLELRSYNFGGNIFALDWPLHYN